MKRKIFALFLLIFFSLAFPAAVSANGMPAAHDGDPASGIFAMADCPIEVKAEQLSFRLENKEKNYTISSTVSALYQLYNPTDETLTVPTVFMLMQSRESRSDSIKVSFRGEALPFVRQRAFLSEEELAEGVDAPALLRPAGEPAAEGLPVQLACFTLTLSPGETAALRVDSETEAFMERDTLDYPFYFFTTERRYTFHYLLSPAKYWGAFENLTIDLQLSRGAPVLKTSSLAFRWAGFRRYRFHSDSLPEGELQFTAMTSVWIILVRFTAEILIAVMLIWGLVRLQKWLVKIGRWPKWPAKVRKFFEDAALRIGQQGKQP